MGTIIQRKRKDGSVAWLAQITLAREGKTVWRENKTFERRAIANSWIEKREKELAKPGALDEVRASKADKRNPTLADAIDRYIGESAKALGRTKTQVLRSIKGFDIASKPCAEITSVDLVEFARQKLDDGVKPQTVSNYLSHLGAVYSIARAAWGYPLMPQAIEDAWKVTKRLGMTRKSQARERRPNLDELDGLMSHFRERSKRRPSSVPMHRLVAFAILSTRRQEEIVRIAWNDLDTEGSRVLVRDMKNPGEKIGNDVWCDLPEEALSIIKAMPKVADQIFPYTTDAVGAAFTRACQLLDIKDLHFHDLRHDGVSRLFELGFNIPHVAAVSGHRSWISLKRYTHLRQTGDKYKDWKWLPVVADNEVSLRLSRKGALPRKLRSERGAIMK